MNEPTLEEVVASIEELGLWREVLQCAPADTLVAEAQRRYFVQGEQGFVRRIRSGRDESYRPPPDAGRLDPA